MKADFVLERKTLKGLKTSSIVDRVLHFFGNALVKRVETGKWEEQGDFEDFVKEQLWLNMEILMEEAAGKEGESAEVILIHQGRFGEKLRSRIEKQGIIFGGHPQSLKNPVNGALNELVIDFVIWLEMNEERVEDEDYSIWVSGKDVVGSLRQGAEEAG